MDFFIGSKVMMEWRDHLLEALETTKNDAYAIFIGKEINDATAFIQNFDTTHKSIIGSLLRKNPNIPTEVVNIEMDPFREEWYKYLENNHNQSFVGAFLNRYNKVLQKLLQELNDDDLIRGFHIGNGTLNPDLFFY
jgi:hypothetical protein